MFEDIFSTFR